MRITTIKRQSVVFAAAVMSSYGCASTKQASEPPEQPAGRKFSETAKDFAGRFTDLTGREAVEQAAKSIQEHVRQINVQQLNQAIARLDEILFQIQVQSDSVTASRLIDSLSQTSQDLSTVIGTFNDKLSELHIEPVGPAAESSRRAFESVGEAAEELRTLLAEAAELIEALNPERMANVVRQIDVGSRHLEQAAARLPSTATTLTTTIWLANVLLGVLITLGILKIMGRRRPAGS